LRQAGVEIEGDLAQAMAEVNRSLTARQGRRRTVSRSNARYFRLLRSREYHRTCRPRGILANRRRNP
ncbi:MAG: hypothetical protein ACREVJ_08810, partial [Gammaproteobacteria bacterium]